MNEEDRTRRARELRQELLEGCAGAARQAFKKHRRVRSVGLLVAQFWDDEAEDAVHGRLVCSELDRPDVEAALGRGYLHSRVRDFVNLPSFTKKRSPPYLSAPWDPNGLAIPAFAAYCKEGGDQNNPPKDNYTLIAVFAREGHMKFVGEQLRPHLDGYPLPLAES